MLKCQFLQDVDHKAEFFQERSGYHEGLDTLKLYQMSCKLYIYMPKCHETVRQTKLKTIGTTTGNRLDCLLFIFGKLISIIEFSDIIFRLTEALH